MFKFAAGLIVGSLLALAALGGSGSANRQLQLEGFMLPGIDSRALEIHEAICEHGQIAICASR